MAATIKQVGEGVFRRLDPKRGTWLSKLWIRYPDPSAPGGWRFESARTANKAEAKQRRSEKIAAASRSGTGARGTGKETVGTILDRLARHYRLSKRPSLDTLLQQIELWRDALGADTPARAVDVDLIQQVQTRWQAERAVTDATINRYGNVLRKAFSFSRDKVGFLVYVPRLDEHPTPGRNMTPAEAARLEAQLVGKRFGYLRDVFATAYDNGTRKGQLARTLREYVSLEPGAERIEWPPALCKSRDPHVIPLVGRSVEIVARHMKLAPLWCPYLFHGPRCAPGRKQAPKQLGRFGCLGDFKHAFETTCRRAGLAYGRAEEGGVTFHSTRHSAATNLREYMDEADVMRVTGHRTSSVFRTHYDHRKVDTLRAPLAAARAQIAAKLAAELPSPTGPAARRRRVRKAADAAAGGIRCSLVAVGPERVASKGAK